MLGLASTLSSSSTPESKYSLNFDGTDDYLDTGATFNTTFAGSFSISLWMRPDDGQPASAEYVFGSNEGDTTDDSGIRLELLTNTLVRFVLKSNEADVYNDTSAAIFTNNAQDGWTHIVCIATKNSGANTTLSMYKNGSAVTLGAAKGSGVSEADHAAFSTVRNLYIGARNHQGTAQTFYDGKIADFAIWNVALDADAVTAIYNIGRPTNLTFDSGNYDNSSALVAYYKMGNGSFDDKAVGIIHDQHDASGYGAELVTNGDFSTSGTFSPTSYSLGFYEAGDAGITISDGALNLFKENTDGNSGRAYVSNGVNGGISMTDNKTYKVSYTIKENSDSSAMQIYDGAAYKTVASTVGSHVYYFVHNGSNLVIKNNGTLADESTIKISSFSLQKLKNSSGFGAELVTNGHFDTNTTGWAADSGAGGSSITQGAYGGRSGVARVVIDSTDSDDRYKQDITWEKDCLYYFSVDMYLLSGSFRIDGVDADIIGVGSNSNYGSTNVLGTITYDASVDDRWRTLTGYAQGQRTGGTDEIWIRSGGEASEFYVDNFSIKKLNGLPALTSDANVSGGLFSSDAP